MDPALYRKTLFPLPLQVPLLCAHLLLHTPDAAFTAIRDKPLTNNRFYDRLVNFLQPKDIVLADAGLNDKGAGT